jgi:hypothetical protein
MADRALEILQHALGLDEYGRARSRVPGYDRNHFCTGEGSVDFADCTAHVEAGRMERHGPSALYGGPSSYCFVVTELGRAFVREHSPKPPKKTRAQRRYERWLDVSDATGQSFGEWLKAGGSRG